MPCLEGTGGVNVDFGFGDGDARGLDVDVGKVGDGVFDEFFGVDVDGVAGFVADFLPERFEFGFEHVLFAELWFDAPAGVGGRWG